MFSSLFVLDPRSVSASSVLPSFSLPTLSFGMLTPIRAYQPHPPCCSTPGRLAPLTEPFPYLPPACIDTSCKAIPYLQPSDRLCCSLVEGRNPSPIAACLALVLIEVPVVPTGSSESDSIRGTAQTRRTACCPTPGWSGAALRNQSTTPYTLCLSLLNAFHDFDQPHSRTQPRSSALQHAG